MRLFHHGDFLINLGRLCFAVGFIGSIVFGEEHRLASGLIGHQSHDRLNHSYNRCTIISIKAFFLAACQICFLPFVSLFRRSVSGPSPYLSCRPCLPLPVSISR